MRELSRADISNAAGPPAARRQALTRSIASYTLVAAVSALLVLNPLVVYLVSGSRSLAAFALVLDVWLALIATAGALHLWRGGRTFFWLMTAGIATLLPALFAGEVALAFVRHQYADHLLGEVPEIFRPDERLIYAPIPGARGRHAAIGEFDVEYVIDELGRKAVPQSPAARRTVHVFGDSFTFGFGVANADTWPNLLSARLGDEVNVLNYGVIGYSLEQMAIALEKYQDQLRPGDVVLIAPISADLERSLVGKLYVCGGMIRAEANEVFPRLAGDRWVYERLDERCNFVLDSLLANSPLPIGFGSLYRQRHHRATWPAMIANAEAIFARSERLAAARDAELVVAFLATPEECARGAFDIDIAPLGLPSLLPHCPPADAAGTIRFPHNGHYNPEGHAWAAAAIHRILLEQPAWRAGD
jgi:hypothetical protein